jgi:hypothetical protein
VLVCPVETKNSLANSGEDKKNPHSKQQRLRKKDQRSHQLHVTDTKSNAENSDTEDDSAGDVSTSDKKVDQPEKHSPSTTAATPPAQNEYGVHFDSYETSTEVNGLDWPPSSMRRYQLVLQLAERL